MRGFCLSCLTDNKVQNRPWGKLWGKVSFERGRFQALHGGSGPPTFDRGTKMEVSGNNNLWPRLC